VSRLPMAHSSTCGPTAVATTSSGPSKRRNSAILYAKRGGEFYRRRVASRVLSNKQNQLGIKQPTSTSPPT
jgi:hypothetical protein